MNQQSFWWKTALVLTIDLLWSLLLEQLGRPLFVGLFPGQAANANRLLDTQLITMLWISYGIVLTAQIGWLAWASSKQSHWQHKISIESQQRRLRRAWWWCALAQLAVSFGLIVSLVLELSQAVDPAGLLFVLGLLLCDLLVIYWLPTGLLVPDEVSSAVPLRGRIGSGRRDHRQIEP